MSQLPIPAITATELKINLAKYLDYVIDNNEVVVSKNGKKAIRLIPYSTDYHPPFIIGEITADYLETKKQVRYGEFLQILG